MRIKKYTKIANRSILLGCALFIFVKIAIPFPGKWKEFREDEKRLYELQSEISVVDAEAKALRHNQERFITDKFFVQKLAHELGYAHEGEIIFEFSEATNRTHEGELK